MRLHERVTQDFQRRFGCAPEHIARAPGRVNLIGEHTDYNDGFVLPMAIDREVCIALRRRKDSRVIVHSLDFEETVEFDHSALTRGNHGWGEYVKGIAYVLADEGVELHGWEGVMSGNVPRGAGLSSSAAVELAGLHAFAAAGDLPWHAREAALRGRRVENEWIGVNSGIMDPLVVAAAQANHALLIDCRSLDTSAVPLPADHAIIVLDTSTRRGLVDSAYNERRTQCEAAARALGVSALRDIGVHQMSAHGDRLDSITLRRARHVVTENERTLLAAAALRCGEVQRVGELMNASHASLRADFEVTNSALDDIVDIAQAHPACVGARMTGAGFGGCAVALVDLPTADQFIADVERAYLVKTGLVARAYICRADNGASLETPDSSVYS